MTFHLNSSMAGFTRHGYLLHVRTQRCVNCGASHTYSEMREILTRRSDKGRMDVPRVKQIAPGFPVEQARLPDETVPVCHACFAGFSNNATTPLSEAEWSETLKRKAFTEPPPKADSASRFPKNPTIDDL